MLAYDWYHPKEHCGWVDGKLYALMLEADSNDPFGEATTPLRESIGEEFFLALEVMKTLVPEGGSTKDVRIVFDFDS